MTRTEALRAAYRREVAADRRKRVEAQVDRAAEAPKRAADARLEMLLALDADESPEADAVRAFLTLDRDHVRSQILRLVGRTSTPLLDRYAEQAARDRIAAPTPSDLPPLDSEGWARLAEEVLQG